MQKVLRKGIQKILHCNCGVRNCKSTERVHSLVVHYEFFCFSIVCNHCVYRLPFNVTFNDLPCMCCENTLSIQHDEEYCFWRKKRPSLTQSFVRNGINCIDSLKQLFHKSLTYNTKPNQTRYRSINIISRKYKPKSTRHALATQP